MANPLLVIGQVAPHLRERADAIALCAKVRPVGSVNVEAVSKERGIAAKRMMEAHHKGMALVEEGRHVTTSLNDYFFYVTLDEIGTNPWPDHYLPHIAQYVEATDSIRLIRVQGVREKKMNFATAKPRIFTETEEGAMLLPDGTVLVWLPTAQPAS